MTEIYSILNINAFAPRQTDRQTHTYRYIYVSNTEKIYIPLECSALLIWHMLFKL